MTSRHLVFIRVAAAICSIALAAALATGARADEKIDACVASPSRACVLDLAVAEGAGAADPALHASIIAFVAAAQERAGLEDAAAANLARAIEETKALGKSQSDRPRASIAAAKAEMGEFAAAEEEARSIKSVDRRITALVGVAMALQRQGRASEAAADFEQAIGAAQSAPDKQRVIALVNIARAEAKAGRDEAPATFDLARKAARDGHDAIFAAVVTMQQSEAGEFVQAFLAIQGLPENRRNMPLQALAIAEARAGKLEEAAAVAGSITYEPGQVAALAAVSVGESRASQSAPAIAHIKAAQQAADAITEPDLRGEAEAAIAGAQAAAGLFEEAKAGLEAARQESELEHDAGGRYSTTATIALALARAGRVPEAIETALRQSSPGAKISSLIAIAADREAAKADGEALSALLAIPTDEARTFNLVEFAGRLPR